MAAKTALTVSLTPELEQFIAEQVKTGYYKSASEVVREGLRLLLRTQGEHPHVSRGKRSALTHGGGHGG